MSWAALGAFAAIMLAIALPWYVVVCVRLPQFGRYFLWEHNVVRFLAPFDHLEPIWYYGPILLAGFLPATLFAIPFIRFLFSGDAREQARRRPALGFALLAGGWCVLFFSLSGCKLPTYIMPAFPPLALSLGYFVSVSKWAGRPMTRALVAMSFVAMFAGNNLGVPFFAGYRAPAAHIAEVSGACAGQDAPVVCYPRNCDSMGFYIARDDLRTYRSKQTHLLVYFMQQRPKTILLLTHRHSLQGLRQALTSDLEITHVEHFGLGNIPGLSEALSMRLAGYLGETSLGLCDLAVVERARVRDLSPKYCTSTLRSHALRGMPGADALRRGG